MLGSCIHLQFGNEGEWISLHPSPFLVSTWRNMDSTQQRRRRKDTLEGPIVDLPRVFFYEGGKLILPCGDFTVILSWEYCPRLSCHTSSTRHTSREMRVKLTKMLKVWFYEEELYFLLQTQVRVKQWWSTLTFHLGKMFDFECIFLGIR